MTDNYHIWLQSLITDVHKADFTRVNYTISIFRNTHGNANMKKFRQKYVVDWTSFILI